MSLNYTEMHTILGQKSFLCWDTSFAFNFGKVAISPWTSITETNHCFTAPAPPSLTNPFTDRYLKMM